MRQQGQCGRGAGDFIQERLRQARLQYPSVALGRLLNSLAQFLPVHGTDVLLLLRYGLAQFVEGRTLSVEVSSQSQHHNGGNGGPHRCQHVIYKGLASDGIVASQSEQFLELIHDHRRSLEAAHLLHQTGCHEVEAARLTGQVIDQPGDPRRPCFRSARLNARDSNGRAVGSEHPNRAAEHQVLHCFLLILASAKAAEARPGSRNDLPLPEAPTTARSR